MADTSMQQLAQQIEDEAVIIDEREKQKEELQAKEQNAIDDDGNLVKLIPNPVFSDAVPLGALLPLNMANEIVSNLSNIASEINLLEYLRRELGYANKLSVSRSFAAEQVDALCLAIKSFEKGNAFILGDMAGIGKGRVCAGVMRYAFMKGMIPVFVTQKAYLFNDIYRDFMDIDGIGSNSRKTSILPRPLVLHPLGVIINPATGNPLDTKQAIKVSRSAGGVQHTFVGSTKTWSINEICKGLTEKIQDEDAIDITYTVGGETEKFNCVMLPYSVISQGSNPIKRNFLTAIAPNAIFVFDESHNAASANVNSNILKRSLEYVENCKAVLFSSATYAKNPNVFQLYVVKTALRNAVPSLEVINSALKVGGENVSEYIAGGLCKEGQMIRRERSFGDCQKITEYAGTIRQTDFTGKTTYTPIAGDNQMQFFDDAIGYFKEMRDFTKNEAFKEAALACVFRYAQSERINVISMADYRAMQNLRRDDAFEDAFIRQYRRQYYPIFEIESINRYKATFRSNVFLAAKAKFSADKIIECLNTPVSYTNIDGSTHYAPLKPIVAVSNTGEAIFDELRLKEGDMVPNDFAQYLRAVYNKLFLIKVKYRRVDSNFFKTDKECIADGIERDEIKTEVFIEDDDLGMFASERYRIQNMLNAYVTDVPFSIIDYIRDRIENTPRASIYFDSTNGGDAKYGSLNSINYSMLEGTSRSHMLVRRGNMFEYVRNTRPRSTTDLFKRFNNGLNDVLLINVVASTGGSAQSSPKEGVDTRPRNMFIVQFELDVNVEVQKRGRINRSGQINFPTYTYVISRIPAEIRQYLMLRKKLRKLDANVSADQTASSKSAEITDPEGNAIHDIYNAYGFNVFTRDFITDENNQLYASIFSEMKFRSTPRGGADASEDGLQGQGDAEETEANIAQFNEFVRELELYPSSIQLNFFNQMNTLYELEKQNLEAQGLYQEELKPKNYKAVLRQRVVKQINSGESIFSLPLFLSDYYTLDDSVPYSKEKIDRRVAELSVWNGERIPPNDFHTRLIDDFRAEKRNFATLYGQAIDETSAPRRQDYVDDASYQEAADLHETRKAMLVQGAVRELNSLEDLIIYFRPRRPIQHVGGRDAIEGMFLGYKFRDTNTRFKYSKSNIRFVFAFTAEITQLSSTVQQATEIRETTQRIEGSAGTEWHQRVRDWRPDTDRRITRRFYAGNILSGIVEAQNNRDNPTIDSQRVNSFFLSRFYNLDGSVTTAVELEVPMTSSSEIRAMTEELSISTGTELFERYILLLPITSGETLATNLYPVWNVPSDKICDRAVAVVHKEAERVVGGTTVKEDIIEFRIVQSFAKQKDAGQYRPRSERDSLYNVLYNNPEVLSDFEQFKVGDTTMIQNIRYAYRPGSRTVEGDREILSAGIARSPRDKIRSEYQNFYVRIRTYAFNLSMTNSYGAYRNFLRTLYEGYDMAFSFRSGADEYFNIELQEDIYVAGSNEQRQQAFPEGDYEYRFIRQIPEKNIEKIPGLKSRTNTPPYGGVIVKIPISPNRLPSYTIQPYSIPSDILFRLMTSVLDGTQKGDFMRELERMPEDVTDEEVGEFVRRFLRTKGAPINYFFGDALEADYGKLVKDTVRRLDVETLVMSGQAVEQNRKIMPMTEQNVEDFLLKLMQLI